MFKDIQVRSRNDMIAASDALSDPSVIISISDINQDHPQFADNENVLDVLFLQFDDVESEREGGMSKSDAELIADFAGRWASTDTSLYVHCGAGVSRSAGTAAAIMLWQWGGDSRIFSDGKYAPNMHCYRAVIDAVGLDYDDIQLAKKEREQFELWSKQHEDLLD